MTTELTNRLSQSITKVENNSKKLEDIVNGTNTAVVAVASGSVKTVAKAIKDAEDSIITDANSYLNQLEAIKIAIETKQTEINAKVQEGKTSIASANLPDLNNSTSGQYIRVKTDKSGYEFATGTYLAVRFYYLTINEHGHLIGKDSTTTVNANTEHNVNDYFWSDVLGIGLKFEKFYTPAVTGSNPSPEKLTHGHLKVVLT